MKRLTPAVTTQASGIVKYLTMLGQARVAQKAIAHLWLGTAATAAAALMTQVLLARSLGPSAFGNLFSALAILNLLTPLVAFGIPSFWLKAFGEEGRIAARWIAPSYKFALISGAFCMSSLLLWTASGNQDQTAKTLLMLLLPLLISQPIAAMVSSVLQIEGRFNHLAKWDAATNLIRLTYVATYVAIAGKAVSEITIALGYTSIALTVATIGALKLARFLKSNSEHIEETQSQSITSHSIARVGSESWKYGLNALLYIIYYQIDIIMLEKMVGPVEAGIYSAAYLMIGATYTVPGVVFQKYLMPKLHYWHFNDRKKVIEIAIKGTFGMAALGLIAAIAVGTTASYLVPWVFGNEYTKAVPIIYVLCLAIPLKFSSTCLNVALTSGVWLQTKIKILGTATVLNIMVNMFAIPKYGATGAAWVTVGTEAVLLALSIIAARTYTKDARI